MKYYTYLIVLGEQPSFGICVAAGKRKQNDAQQQTRNSAIQHSSFFTIQVVTSREGRGDAARGAAPTRERGVAASRVSHQLLQFC